MSDSISVCPSSSKVLNLNSINPHILSIEVAVRKPLIQRALQLEEEVKNHPSTPFSHVVRCDLGDNQAMGQQPITFFRQVIAALCCPYLLEDPSFAADVKERVRRLLDSCAGNNIGSYTNPLGLKVVREDVAAFIEQRDGIPSNIDDIFISSGTTEAVKYILRLISTGLDGNERAGVMIPVPAYSLYTTTTTELNLFQIKYYLDGSHNWDLNLQELTRALSEAQNKCIPRAIVVVNPGNPTGQILSQETMEQVIRFAVENRLILLADEVYQLNIYRPWISFKRVLHQMGTGVSDRLEIASLMTCSKGYIGECGIRGGYCELTNFDPDVRSQLYKALTYRLCPSVLGQAMVDCFVNPPKKHEPSYANFAAERDAILEDLRHKAELVTKLLGNVAGVSCNPIQGSLYAFPRISLPPRAIEAAEKCGQKPDMFYCFRLLEEKGVCVVPGSDFGQVAGTYHFRTTTLPPAKRLKAAMDSVVDFHTDFLAKYAS